MEGVSSSGLLRDRGLRFRYMITETAKERARIITFWGKHGLAATLDAYTVSLRTLRSWRATLKQGRVPQSKIESVTAHT